MKSFNPRKEASMARIISGRKVKQSFLIITEGLNTEPDYFNAFRITSAKVKAIGKGLNTVSLVKEAIIIRDVERRKGNIYDQYWVVFDKDDYSAQEFNEALRLAKTNDIRVAYSNQAIEYWFLLHYNLYRGKLHRSRYASMLTKLMHLKYEKRSQFTEALYFILLPHQPEAIKRAKTILEETKDVTPAQAESSTTVHLLVQELNKYL